MQRTADRRRALAAHGVLMSDERLPTDVLDLRQVTSVEGTVLVHGQDEQTGRNYLMLEGTDAKVHFIQYTPEMEEARSRGEFRVNSFVRLRKRSGAAILDVSDLGDADRLPKNPRHLNETLGELLKRGIAPTEDGWDGWLGRYQAALCKITREIEERKERDLARGQPGLFARAMILVQCGNTWRGVQQLLLAVIERATIQLKIFTCIMRHIGSGRLLRSQGIMLDP